MIILLKQERISMETCIKSRSAIMSTSLTPIYGTPQLHCTLYNANSLKINIAREKYLGARGVMPPTSPP